MVINSIVRKLDEARRRYQERISEPEVESFDIPTEFDSTSALDLLELDLLQDAATSEGELMQTEEDTEQLPTALDYAVPVVASWESFRAKPYYATQKEKEKGILTVGYGQTEGVTPDMTVTEEGAIEYLRNQLANTQERLEKELGENWYTLSPSQQGSLLSLAYNVDKDVVGQLKKSKALKALKKGDLDKFLVEAFDSSKGFVRQGGEVLAGLQRRREAEENLFLFGDESDFDITNVMNA